MNIDIIDYLGKYEEGVMVYIGLKYEDDYYQGNFYYKKELIVVTFEERLEEKIGSSIEDWENYDKLVYLILSKLVPYEEIINIVSDLDIEKYNLFLEKK